MQKYSNVDEQTKKAHIDAIHENMRQFNRDGNHAYVCPLCGNKLILRTAIKGKNAGNQFYGCSSFPKCRYTMDVGDLKSITAKSDDF